MPQQNLLESGQPIEKASKALILLHGRGGSAQDILSLAEIFCGDSFYVAAPQAPNNSWYPYSFMAEDRTNEPWLSSAVETVKELMDKIAKNIPQNQLYLVGFSQGACLALEVATRYAARYGGIAAFTGGLIGQTIQQKKYQGNFEGTQVFIGNSDRDPHVPLSRSEESKSLIEKLGGKVTLKVYQGMGHTINEDEINWVKKFIFS